VNGFKKQGLRRRNWLLGNALALPSLPWLGACGGGSSSSPDPTAGLTIAPSASSPAMAGDPVMLDAHASGLPLLGRITYNWSVTDPNGAAVALQDAAGAHPYFVAATAGTYTGSLSITLVDGVATGSTPTASLSVTVASPPPPSATDIRSRIRTLAADAQAYAAPDHTSPTLTLGTADGASGIANSRLVAWTRPEFIYSGDVQLAGATYPDILLGSNHAVSYAADQHSGNYLSIDFVSDAPTFEVLQKGLGASTRMRVVVDGRLANTAPLQLPADGAIYPISVRFAGRATRKVRLLIDNPAFAGIRVSEADLVDRPSATTRLRAMFLGDSITEGTAGQDAVTSYAPRTAELLGWKDAWISGVGATGYLAAPAPKLTLRQRYSSDVKAYAPAVLVVAAGVNDVGYTDDAIQTEAALLFDQIQADLPTTLVFVAGPWATSARARPGINTALKNAMGTRSNFIWVPNVDDAWISGTGNVSAPNGTGNADLYISADVTHPTAAGIEYLAQKLAAFIASAT
jgi:lysophospholipase L1-like esterase